MTQGTPERQFAIGTVLPAPRTAPEPVPGPVLSPTASPAEDRDTGTVPVSRRTAPAASEGRTTRQRRTVAQALAGVDGFVTAQALHQRLLDQGNAIGLATVYRNLARLADSGEADVLRAVGGETAYRRCSPTHHHHLVCRNCGRAIEIAGDPLEAWARAAAAEHGFRDITHVAEIDGLCPDC